MRDFLILLWPQEYWDASFKSDGLFNKKNKIQKSRGCAIFEFCIGLRNTVTAQSELRSTQSELGSTQSEVRSTQSELSSAYVDTYPLHTQRRGMGRFRHARTHKHVVDSKVLQTPSKHTNLTK